MRHSRAWRGRRPWIPGPGSEHRRGSAGRHPREPVGAYGALNRAAPPGTAVRSGPFHGRVDATVWTASPAARRRGETALRPEGACRGGGRALRCGASPTRVPEIPSIRDLRDPHRREAGLGGRKSGRRPRSQPVSGRSRITGLLRSPPPARETLSERHRDGWRRVGNTRARQPGSALSTVHKAGARGKRPNSRHTAV
jgi:hypothetical protein